MRWGRVGNISFNPATGTRKPNGKWLQRFWGRRVIFYIPVCILWRGQRERVLITKYFICASGTIEAIPVVLRTDPNFLRSHLPLPLCKLSPHPSFYTRTSFLLSAPPSKTIIPLETFSIITVSQTHIRSHCILSSIASNNFINILFPKKSITSWG